MAPTASATIARPSKRRSASARAIEMPTIGPNSIAINMAPMMTAGEFSISPNPAMNAAATFIATYGSVSTDPDVTDSRIAAR